MQPSLLPAFEDQAFDRKHGRFNFEYPEAELVFGLVCAIGTEYEPVLSFVQDKIRLARYTPIIYKVSSWFAETIDKLGLPDKLIDTTEYDRIASRIAAGNGIRAKTKQADIFALIAASKIFSSRELDDKEDPTAHKKTAHIVVSLKRPEEVESLRKIYGPGFYLIGVFADESQRIEFLTGRKALEPSQANELIDRDQKEKDLPYGQRTRDTFQMADVFVGLAERQYESGLDRFLKLVFGDPFSTPTRDEHSMFLAYAASLRSGDLSRQVGAALACSEGDVISLGCNDVPSPGGGLYTCEGDADHRDHTRGEDSNDVKKREIVDDVIRAFAKKFLPDKSEEEVLSAARPVIRETLVSDLTEYGRSVHAEMDALMAAGRIGVSYRDSVLYTTTFPCHTCTRHIIAAGVKRVVYIEPYPKSLAPELHEDAIRISTAEKGDRKIPFEPFLGIGPRRFFDLFSLKLSSGYTIERKTDGKMVEWDYRSDAKPRVPMAPTSYLEREQLIQKTLVEIYRASEATQDVTKDQSEGRQRVLEPTGEDGSTSRKLARMEDRRAGNNSAPGAQREPG